MQQAILFIFVLPILHLYLGKKKEHLYFERKKSSIGVALQGMVKEKNSCVQQP